MTPLNLTASLAALTASAALASPLALSGSAPALSSAFATQTAASSAAAQVASARSAQTASRSTARVARPATTAKASKVKTSDGEASDTSTAATCKASHYWEDTETASGQPFRVSAMKAAHKTLPMGTKLRVTNPANGKSVVVTINDRGPYIAGRCLDLTTGAFRKIANPSAGVITVRYTRL